MCLVVFSNSANIHLCILGTISVLYLITLVTVKAVHLGFHLHFHWFDTSQFYVPGKSQQVLMLLYCPFQRWIIWLRCKICCWFSGILSLSFCISYCNWWAHLFMWVSWKVWLLCFWFLFTWHSTISSCNCDCSDVPLCSFRVQTSLPAANRCPHPGLLYS